MLALDNCYAGRVIEFEILEKGDASGYCEEAYFVVENETDWTKVWERHTLIYEPRGPPPSINFSVNVVVCAFMGRCPTAGYSIDVERIWTDGMQVFVEIVKCGPPEGFAVVQMVTCPYIMVLVEKTDMPFVFCVVDCKGNYDEYVLVEFPLTAIGATSLFAFSCFALIFKAKNRERV